MRTKTANDAQNQTYIFFRDIPMTITLKKGKAVVQYSDDDCIEDLEIIANLGKFKVSALGIGIDGEYRPIEKMMKHLPLAIETLHEHRSGFTKPLDKFYSGYVN